MPDSIAERLVALPQLSKAALADLWRQLFKTDPPSQTRRELLLPILAYRIQEDAFGSLRPDTRRRLCQLATTFEADPNAVVSNRPPRACGKITGAEFGATLVDRACDNNPCAARALLCCAGSSQQKQQNHRVAGLVCRHDNRIREQCPYFAIIPRQTGLQRTDCSSAKG